MLRWKLGTGRLPWLLWSGVTVLVLAVMVSTVWAGLQPEPGGHSPRTAALLRCEPSAATGPADAPLSVDIYVQDVVNLYGADVQLTFDTTLAQVVDADLATSGVQIQPLSSFLKPDFVIFKTADNSAGTIHYALTQLNPSEPATGSGPLARVQFQPLQAGEFTMLFVYHMLSDRNGVEIPSVVQGCIVTFTDTAPGGSPTVTSTPSSTPTVTPTGTAASVATTTSTATSTRTPTPTATSVPIGTPTATQTRTRTPTLTATSVAVSTATATPTASRTPTVTPTVTSAPADTSTGTPTPTETSTAFPSTLTVTPTPTATALPEATSTPSPTATPDAATATPTPTPSPEPVETPTATPSPTPEATPTASPVPTETPSTATISGVVFLDINRNGQMDAVEAGIGGVLIWAQGLNDGGSHAAVTEADGSFSLTDLPVGAVYLLLEIDPPGYQSTTPNWMWVELPPSAAGQVVFRWFGDWRPEYHRVYLPAAFK